MAGWKLQATTTAELYQSAMRRTGEPPSDKDTIDLRGRQAQQTHLALHRHMRSRPDDLLGFVEGLVEANDLVWTLWGSSDAGFGWDLIKGRKMLDAAAMLEEAGIPETGGWKRSVETTVMVPDALASQLLFASYGEGRSMTNPFGARGAALCMSLPSERRNPLRFAVVAASEPA
ncbi:hypothetical protein [Methylobacterium sp. Leaf117]|uniref:hypothetical protein n=1 Tax=Methylobacterium sp. Leaf117 TaxID=1736260 RepID=UPI0006FE64F2|nr:hypothetical protein [Methylobacterium sp. Leaf117]